MSVLRMTLAALVLISGILLVSFMQFRFDQSDLRHAVEAVQARVPGALGCRAEILSRVKGEIRVSCQGRVWAVDVVKGLIIEENHAG